MTHTPAPPPRKQRSSKLDPFRHLVGVRSDAQVAALAGLTAEAVRLFRKRRGIASAKVAGTGGEELPPEPGAALPVTVPATESASEAPARTGSRRGPRSKLDAVRAIVGVLSDGDVAARVGLTRSAVQMYRLKYAIPAAPSAGRPRTAVVVPPLAAPLAHAEARLVAWKITIRLGGAELVRFAVTPDLVGAARLSMATGDVVSIERLGEALG